MSALHPLNHTWRLVGPWYRWPHPGLPDDGRVAAPAIQKFAGNDFITQFLAKPQHSLKYDEVIDVVQTHDLVKAGTLPGKLGTMLALNAKGEPLAKGATGDAFRARLAPGSLRKLYQPTHDRHYIVSCELHCDEPGFPRVARQRVCQAGFVVRRRKSVVPEGVNASDIEAQAAIVRKTEAELYELLTLQETSEDTTLAQALRDNAKKRMQALAAAQWLPSWSALMQRRRAELADKRSAFAAWQKSQGISVQIEGWFPQAAGSTAQSQRGEWRALATEAAQTADITSGEQFYPLYALVPDPRETTHDAAGRTLYYGVVPTQDLQHDLAGKPHFDDLSTYELRCFARAHHECPPKAGRQPDCNGPLTWSRPSEAFRLAAAFDVLGSANRPITIKMPDLRDLAAQAAMRPRGKLSPVHFVQPQHMSPKELGGEAICSFSIPLITIVALFVLNLFLPVVVFLFQLWFLLVFRFCIPPQIKIAMDVDAALAVTPPGVDFEADFAVEVSGVAQTAAQLNALLTAGSGSNPQDLGDRIIEDTGSEESVNLGGLDNNALATLNQSFADAAALKATDGSLQPPETGEPLEYEAPVTPVWPVRAGT
ncbi:MAG: hypothetical protein ACOZJZ_06335 [Pseudomonadota bacterium]